MLNTYPIWKYTLIAAVILFGFIYALPNLYPPDFAIQISAEASGGVFDQAKLDRVTGTLKQAGIQYFGDELRGNSGLIRLNTDDDQLRAKAVAQRTLDDTNQSYVVALNSAATTPDWLESIGAQPMKYGLDLRGGVHFLMEVDTAQTIADRLKGQESDVKRKLREAKLRYKSVTTDENGILRVLFQRADSRDQARSLLESQHPEFVFQSLDEGGYLLLLTLTQQEIDNIEDYAVKQNVQTIRNRVNELGVAEPLVQSLGGNRIVVDLPGVQDTAQAKKILGKVATLEFRFEAKPDAPRSTVLDFPYEGRTARLEKKIIVRGDQVVDAQVGFDPDTSLPQVNIALDGTGGELMHRATRNNVGRRLGVLFIETKTRTTYEMVAGEEVRKTVPYIVKRVISLATVQSALANRFRITGLDAAEARDLALLLRAGALAADMYIAEERTVGASLGEENVLQGAISVAVGLGMVLLFMLFKYRMFGFAANIALTANLVLLIAIMSSISATLTLPGIAGIVLTVGMAVDANVLIFARIREELANKMTPQAAINVGFERAFVTILDANITTLLVAVILYSIGTGPIKGFAVTLSIGIMTSMFTAIMGTRALVNLIYGGRNIKTLRV
jgi:preprotein translocase subunit SecD|tara:strand:- start:5971 stop:7821 length:1851 start_codon:yes stop_codon:yes gene_type:complete